MSRENRSQCPINPGYWLPLPPDIAKLFAKLIDGKELEPEEEEQLAEACDREPPDIHQASKKIRQQRRNGNAKARS